MHADRHTSRWVYTMFWTLTLEYTNQKKKLFLAPKVVQLFKILLEELVNQTIPSIHPMNEATGSRVYASGSNR